MAALNLRLPELAAIAGTRALLGVGIGLLVSLALAPDKRRGVGTALVAIGVLTTIPLAKMVIGRVRESGDGRSQA
jgi:hypothetical protein